MCVNLHLLSLHFLSFKTQLIRLSGTVARLIVEAHPLVGNWKLSIMFAPPGLACILRLIGPNKQTFLSSTERSASSEWCPSFLWQARHYRSWVSVQAQPVKIMTGIPSSKVQSKKTSTTVKIVCGREGVGQAK